MVAAPMRAAVRKAATFSSWRARRQSAIPATKAPVVSAAAAMVWTKVASAVELVRTARKSLSSARPVAGLYSKPTGCCIHAFAARMK